MIKQPHNQPFGKKYLKPEDVRQLKNLFIASRTIIDGAYSGHHKSPYKGSAQEFTDYREYYPGDDIRSIDWKAYARTDRHMIKLFEKETNLTCHILVDSSASMAFGGPKYSKVLKGASLSKFEYGSYLAAAIAYLVIKQGDRVGLTLFDNRIKQHIPPGGTYSHLYRILSELEFNLAGEQTSISQTLREAYPIFKRKGLLIIISDLIDEPDDIFGALNMYLHRGFDITLLQVMHKHELDLPSMPSVNFIDSESGQRLTTVPDDIRRAYKQHIQGFVKTISQRARARRIDHELISTETPFHAALRNIIERRK